MDTRYFSEAHFFGNSFESTGLTPFLNGSTTDQNVFENEYAAHAMSNNNLVKNGDMMPLPKAPSTESNDDSYDPQMFGKSRELSSSSSCSSGQHQAPHDKTGPTFSKRSSPELTGDFLEDGQEPETTVKRSRFLERNRLAAAKCRTKKKEWTNNLEAAARQASLQTRELHAIVQNLRDEVMQYKTQLMSHQGCECHAIRNYLLDEHARSCEDDHDADEERQDE